LQIFWRPVLIFKNNKVMEWNKLHLIKSSDSNLAFYYPTYTLIEISDTVFNVLERVKSSDSLQEIAMDFNFQEKELSDFLENIESKLTADNAISNITVNRNSRNIFRITLHISNDCNLRCKYCYADGGNYNLSRGLMTIETAQNFVDFCVQHFDNIGNIVFFGGEPLMNIDAMEYICEKIDEYHRQGRIKKLPTFGIITNGTIINERLLALMKKYISFITVSIDGPKAINDANRVYPNGSGSYDKIDKFIKTIKSETNVDIKYEATYTESHIQENISKKELTTFFLDEFAMEGTIADEMSLNVDSCQELSDFFKKENFTTSDLRNLPRSFWDILTTIVYKKPKQMCQIYSEIVAISAEGDIYPCHINTGKEHLRLGNISGRNIFNSPDEYKTEYPLFFNLNNREEICGDCWAQNICGGCTMLWFYDENDENYTTQPNESLCLSNKKFLEDILLLISNIRKNPEKWKLFQEYINNKKASTVLRCS